MNAGSDNESSRRITRTLDGLKKEAKDWLRDLRANDANARARLDNVMPTSSGDFSLRDVQHAIALEHGFAGWAVLKGELEKPAGVDVHAIDRANWLLEHACIDPILTNGPSQQAQHRNAAMRIWRKHPEVARANILTAIVCGDVVEVRRILRERPMSAVERGGPIRLRYNKARESLWSPILHLCYGRLPIAAAADNALETATLLFDHGANPNDYFEVGSHPSRYTAMTGLVGGGEEGTPVHPQAQALVTLLLDRGANPLDVQFIYNTALSGTVFEWFDQLYDASVEAGREAEWSMPTWNPSQGMSAFDWLWHSAREQHDYERMRWFEARGAHGLGTGVQSEMILPVDEFMSTSASMDESRAKQLLELRPDLLADYRALFAAVRQNHVNETAFLLDLGIPIDVEDESGQQALHVAASNNAFDVVKLLAARGADFEAREKNWNNTPLDHALYGNQTEMIKLLASYSRNIFQLTWIGEISRMREVLSEESDLATRVDESQTPLMVLPDDERLAVEAVQLLLAHGADASVVDSHGRTAAYYARKRGLDEAADVLESVAN